MSIALSDKNTTLVTPTNVVRNIYGDLSLAFSLHPGTKDIKPITDIDAVRQAVKNLIVCSHTDRLFHPELGTSITSLLFENADVFTAMTIRDEVQRILQKYEPRVDNVKVQVFDNSERNAYEINIGFRVIQSQQTTEVSFYLSRVR